MRHQLPIVLLCVLLLPLVVYAQDDDEWSCDWGDNDIINAAFDEYDSQNYGRVNDLIALTHEICADDQEHIAYAFYLEGLVLHRQAKPDDALDAYNQALSLAVAESFPYLEADIVHEMGHIYQEIEQYDDAIDSFERFGELGRQLDEQNYEAVALFDISVTYTYLEEYEDAIQTAEDSLAISQAINNQILVMWTLNHLGRLYESQGEYDLALDQYFQAFAISQELEDREGQVYTLNNIGYLFQENPAFANTLAFQLGAILKQVY